MENLISFAQNVSGFLTAGMIIKIVFCFLLVCHLIFMCVVLAQVRSMEKVITQPLSSAVLGFFCLLLVAGSVGLLAITIHLP